MLLKFCTHFVLFFNLYRCIRVSPLEVCNIKKGLKFTQSFCSSCARLCCLQPETRGSNQVSWSGRRRERKHNQLRGRGRRRGRYDGIRHHPPPGFIIIITIIITPLQVEAQQQNHYLILVFQIPIADPSLAHRSLPRQKIPCKFLSSNIECCIL